MDDFDFDDDEGSDHQDYDANYFDNGEGDDDSGGEEGESSPVSCIAKYIRLAFSGPWVSGP